MNDNIASFAYACIDWFAPCSIADCGRRFCCKYVMEPVWLGGRMTRLLHCRDCANKFNDFLEDLMSRPSTLTIEAKNIPLITAETK